MFGEYIQPSYQPATVVRQLSPPVFTNSLSPILPVGGGMFSSSQSFSPARQSPTKYSSSIPSTGYGSSSNIPMIVLPSSPQSQEVIQNRVTSPIMSQSYGAIPATQMPVSPQANTLSSSYKMMPYLQVRTPQPQYADF